MRHGALSLSSHGVLDFASRGLEILGGGRGRENVCVNFDRSSHDSRWCGSTATAARGRQQARGLCQVLVLTSVGRALVFHSRGTEGGGGSWSGRRCQCRIFFLFFWNGCECSAQCNLDIHGSREGGGGGGSQACFGFVSFCFLLQGKVPLI